MARSTKSALLSLSLGLILISAGSLALGFSAIPPARPKFYTDVEAYEVYAAILRSGTFTELAAAQRFAIEEDTISNANRTG